MKQHINMPVGWADELQWLYSPDWVYHDYGDCKRHLQMIFPYRRDMRADERYPLILYIPGSAWRRQEMYNDVTQLALLARRGFVIAMMEYREADVAPFPAQVEDVGNALRFIPTIAENFHIDAGRVFLMGNSSGGHVAMMAALLNAHGLCAPLPELAGVICESGSTDLLLCARSPLPPWMQQRPSALLLGVDAIEGHEEEARRASCGMYVTPEADLPPVLLLHSEHDPVVSVENSRTLCEQLEAAGHQVTYIELRDCDAHGGAAFFADAVLDAVERFCKTPSVQAAGEPAMKEAAMRIGEVCLMTNDVLRLAAFYKQLFGIENGSDDATHQFLRSEETMLTIYNDGTVRNGQNQHIRLAFTVEDMEAAHQKLLVLGAEIIEPPTVRPWGAVSMSFYDPDRNRIYFRCFPKSVR